MEEEKLIQKISCKVGLFIKIDWITIQETSYKMSQTMEQIGGIDGPGFIKSFEYKGFSDIPCVDEIIANSHDAKSTTVVISKEGPYIAISDNGIGMNRETARFMFNVYEQKPREGIGMANLGLKAAACTLSRKTFTKFIGLRDGVHNTADADWKKITLEGIEKNVTLRNSPEEEIELFENISTKHFTEGRDHGFTILFPYNVQLWDTIQDQFKFHRSIDIGKSFAFRYGYTNDTFNIKLVLSQEEIRLQKYNPSNKKNEQTRWIDCMKKPDGTFCFISDRFEEIKPKAGGFSKKPTFVKPDEIEEYECVNRLNIHLSVPEDPNYHLGSEAWFPRELDMFKGNTDTDKNKASQYPVFIRNHYVIGPIIMEEMALSSRRASPEGRQYFDVHMTVSVNQTSMNSLDSIIETQENKGQHQDSFPLPLKRLLHQMKKDYITEKAEKPKAEKVVVEKVEKKKNVPIKEERMTFVPEPPISFMEPEPIQFLEPVLVELPKEEFHADVKVKTFDEVPKESISTFTEVHAETYIQEIHVETCKELQDCQAEMIQQKENVSSQKEETPKEKNLRAIQKIQEHMQQIILDLKESELQRQTIAEDPKHGDTRLLKRLTERIGLLTKQNQDYVGLLGILE